MCCKLAKGHSQVTELATKLLVLRFQKHGVLQKKRAHSPLTGVQGPPGSSSDPSVWPGVLPSCMSIAHVRPTPPCGLSSFQVMTSLFSPPSSWSLLQGQGCRLAESAKTPSFWHLQGPELQLMRTHFFPVSPQFSVTRSRCCLISFL